MVEDWASNSIRWSSTGTPTAKIFGVSELSLPAEVSFERLESRRHLLSILNPQIDRVKQYQGMDKYRERAGSMLSSSSVRDVFELSREDSRTRDLYGRNTTGQSLLLCRRLIEAGVRFITCMNGVLGKAGLDWDTHSNNFPELRRLIPPDDQGFSALI